MPDATGTGWRKWRDGDHTIRFLLTLTERSALEWDRERLEMLEDAVWLIEQTVQGNTEGPLTLPRTGMPIRA